MRNDFESNYLAHHGILGQKWGHKNGPPYPLDAGDHSSLEKKAGWRKSLTGKIQEHRRKKKQFKDDQRRFNSHKMFIASEEYKKREQGKIAKDTSLGRMEREAAEEWANWHEGQIKNSQKVLDDIIKKYGNMRVTDLKDRENIAYYEKKIKDEMLKDYKFNPDKSVAKDYEGKTYKKGSTEELRSRTWNDLEKEISEKSGSWYFQEGVSSGFKQEIERHKKTVDRLDKKYGTTFNPARNDEAREESRKHLNRLSSIVLRDLGYPDTKENREYLKKSHVIDWD